MRALAAAGALFCVFASSTRVGAAECPSTGESIRKEMGVSGEWDVSCTDADSGRRLMAALKKPAAPGDTPTLLVIVKNPDGTAARFEKKLAGPEQAALKALVAETWHVILFEEELDGQQLIHVSTFARVGGATPIAQEIVTLLRLAGGKLDEVWTGFGYRSEQQASGCYLETKMKFKLTATQLERNARTKAKVKPKRKMSPAELKQVKQTCVAPADKKDSFPVTAAPAAPAKGG